MLQEKGKIKDLIKCLQDMTTKYDLFSFLTWVSNIKIVISHIDMGGIFIVMESVGDYWD